jgi:hypothetical protein
MFRAVNSVLQNSESSSLCLTHPSSDELTTISPNTAAAWKDALSHSIYLEESQFMTTVPLARNGGMTSWILVDKCLPPGQRQILCSCESFRKRALKSSADGNVIDTIVHGIASVFCPIEHRGRGYPKLMIRELATQLHSWQTDTKQCLGSILYSDIGKTYYAELGWKPNKSNTHVELNGLKHSKSPFVYNVGAAELPVLCERDEARLRKMMSIPTEHPCTRVSIIPDLDHIGWHLAKEEFTCNYLFQKIPEVKGAIAGSPGSQVWAIWTHRYYNHPDAEKSHNVLYILRLVMEADETASRLPSDAGKTLDEVKFKEQMQHLKAVLQAAQNEAFEWKLNAVRFWDPTPLVRSMLSHMGIEQEIVEREEESIASGLWYDEQGGVSESAPLWLNNEHYAWC